MEPVNSVTIYPYQKILNILFYTNSKKIGSTLPKDSLKSLWMSLELANCEQHRYPMHVVTRIAYSWLETLPIHFWSEKLLIGVITYINYS